MTWHFMRRGKSGIDSEGLWTMGKVYWITGLAGAGKTTIGRALYKKIREQHENVVFLDGDTLREVFGGDLGYSETDRRKCAMRYAKLCLLLAEQGMIVVCCTISMFDSIRQWNREHIQGYYEIYVKVSGEVLWQRNQKGLYADSVNCESADVVGITIPLEEPKTPDMILENEGDLSPEEQADAILDRLEKVRG